jgi:lipopolysaccharide transport system ATP-binding protein
MSEAAVRIEGLGKRYRLTRRIQLLEAGADPSEFRTPRLRERLAQLFPRRGAEIWALRDVTLEIPEGEVFGIVGANGAGKSTLLKVLAEITEPTEGFADVRGRVGSLLEVGTGFHPELSGRDNIYLNGAILGMRRKEIGRKFDEIVEFSGVGRFIDVPVKWYSSGMYVRLAFAVAAFLEPDVLIVDEVLSVGDLAFQRRCLGRMDELAHGGRTVLYVSHNLASVASLCSSACLLDGGRVVDEGPVDRVIQRYVAMNREEARTDLASRSDRVGSGLLRFTGVHVGRSGAVLVGDDVEIVLEYTGKTDVQNVTVALAVYGAMGEPLFLCSTRMAGEDFAVAPRRGHFACRIPRFPLAPGSYSVNVYAEVEGALADWVQTAHVFDVVENDFFGTGALPTRNQGQFVVDHTWSLGDRVASTA